MPQRLRRYDRVFRSSQVYNPSIGAAFGAFYGGEVRGMAIYAVML